MTSEGNISEEDFISMKSLPCGDLLILSEDRDRDLNSNDCIGNSQELLATGLDLQPGICIKILGDIPPDAKHFRIELGKDNGNVTLHFDPRFRFGNDTKVIVCNSREDFYLGREIREKHFPFEQGTMVEVSISFEGKQFQIKLHDDSEFTFPDHLNLQSINYMEISHDFKLKLLSFE